ncbi:hypothetical protein LEP1GSC060_1332 [Leptospira weilii serovar Ranarum str. ICFT]|uniref:Lipoprotein n=1 Tax=Leptospira weilii serovar Ranarum str. ICFT TaxID=1218598 RepID=N1WLZ7_9LEPT|nr:hypothetical protein LEP1GSC060_1332 [Leptospira weilii serovar Ranarum str. ICFT]
MTFRKNSNRNRFENTFVLLRRISFCIVLFYTSFGCGRSLKDKLIVLQKEEKFEEMFLLCLSEKETADTKELCDLAAEKTATGIDKILSEKTELPFSQITVDPEWKKKIETILRNNETFRNRYGNLWKKTIQDD